MITIRLVTTIVHTILVVCTIIRPPLYSMSMLITLAGSYVPRLNKNPTIITMMAGSAISLHLLSGTITTKYRSALHKAASTDPIQHYIQTKNNWSDNEFASINWIAHGRSVCCFYHKKQFIVKFVHEWLPLGRLTSKYKKHDLLTCPTFSHEIEDGELFLRCTDHPQWKLDMWPKPTLLGLVASRAALPANKNERTDAVVGCRRCIMFRSSWVEEVAVWPSPPSLLQWLTPPT